MIFCYSTDGELFYASLEAGSYEEAAEIAESETSLDKGDTFYVGIECPINPADYFNANGILQSISEAMYEEFDDVAEDWPEMVSDKQIDDLSGRLKAELVRWCHDVGCMPKFYSVKGVKEFTAKGEGND